MTCPEVQEANLFVYEKSARHHHENDDENASATTGFKLMFIVLPERLGVRLRISDDVPRGTLVADVAVMYDWARPASSTDDLDGFVIKFAIPQILSCASTVLMDAAKSVDANVPFYGVEAIDRLVDQFTERPTRLSAALGR